MKLTRENLEKYEEASGYIDEASSLIGQAEQMKCDAEKILDSLGLEEYSQTLGWCSESNDYESLALKMCNNQSELECELEMMEEGEQEDE